MEKGLAATVNDSFGVHVLHCCLASAGQHTCDPAMARRTAFRDVYKYLCELREGKLILFALRSESRTPESNSVVSN